MKDTIVMNPSRVEYSALNSADSENVKNMSAVQHYFRAAHLWHSLKQRCSELKHSTLINVVPVRISSESALFVAGFF